MRRRLWLPLSAITVEKRPQTRATFSDITDAALLGGEAREDRVCAVTASRNLNESGVSRSQPKLSCHAHGSPEAGTEKLDVWRQPEVSEQLLL